MSAPSPSAPPRPTPPGPILPTFNCNVMSSQQMFQWLNKNIYSGCAADTQNPICKAVNTAAAQNDASLKSLADQLEKIKESDMISYLQGPGQGQAQVLGSTLLSFLKCYFSPAKDSKKMTNSELHAMSRIKNWYIERYLHSFGKANVPGINFTVEDAKNIQANVDVLLCRSRDEMLRMLLYVGLAAGIALIVGWLLGHNRGKCALAKSLVS